MKNVITQSFITIRLVSLVFFLTLICLFVSLIKNAFGNDDPGCNGWAYVGHVRQETICGPTEFRFGLVPIRALIWPNTGYMTLPADGGNQMEYVKLNDPYDCRNYYDVDLVLWQCNATNGWQEIRACTNGGQLCSYRDAPHPLDPNKIHPKVPPELPFPVVSDPSWLRGDCTCAPPCKEEKQELIETCGSDEQVDWSNWNDETCSGARCLPKSEQNLGLPPC